MTKIEIRADYAAARRAAYPEVGDQLDAIHKLLAAMIDRQPLPPDALEIVRRVQEIKAVYPKPIQNHESAPDN